MNESFNLAIIKPIYVCLQQMKSDEDKEGDSAEDGDDESDDEDEEDDEDSGDEDEDEKNKDDEFNEELVELTAEISIKQKLIEELETSQRRLQAMRSQYENKLLALQAKITTTEEERDKVLRNVKGNSSVAASPEKVDKIKKDYKEKLEKLQSEVSKMHTLCLCPQYVLFFRTIQREGFANKQKNIFI
jgi:chromosome segregation ATPase